MDATRPCGCSDPLPARRGFLARSLALFCGALAYLVPAAAGIATFLNPLRQKNAAAQAVFLTRVDALDGKPRKFTVSADRDDAWNHFPAEPVGAVFVRKVGQSVEAINVRCPHAACVVQYQPDDDRFYCPCHRASFDLGGARADASSPSPRDLDTLEVDSEKLAQGEVWVVFQNFITGIAEKVPE